MRRSPAPPVVGDVQHGGVYQGVEDVQPATLNVAEQQVGDDGRAATAIAVSRTAPWAMVFRLLSADRST